MIDDCPGIAARTEDVVYDEKAIVVIDILEEVLHPMDLYLLSTINHILVVRLSLIRGSKRDVVGLHTQELEAFLHINPYRASSSP